MKKYVLMTILITVFLLAGCDEGPVPESNSTLNKDNQVSTTSTSEKNSTPVTATSSNEPAQSPGASIQYVGPAIRYDFICLAGECTKCPNGGELTITLNADKTVTLSHVGDCMAVGSKGCFSQGPDCGIDLSGSYGNGAFHFTSCNGGKLTGVGTGSYDDKESSGSVTCRDSDEPISTLDWENLARI